MYLHALKACMYKTHLDSHEVDREQKEKIHHIKKRKRKEKT